MPTFTVRTGVVVAGATLLAASAMSIGSIAAASTDDRAQKDSPGNNGTVKVHEKGTSADDRRNQPKVCEFYLVGFGFDAEQQVNWKIQQWPPTGDREVVKTGDLTLDDEGHGRTDDMRLPNGHYKLTWTAEGRSHGNKKHKVFWVNCAPSTSPTESPSEPAESSPSPTTSTAPMPTPAETKLPVTG